MRGPIRRVPVDSEQTSAFVERSCRADAEIVEVLQTGERVGPALVTVFVPGKPSTEGEDE